MITKMEVFSAIPSAPELPLGGQLAHFDPIHIRDINGLGPVKAEIATTPFATSDGELYQGSTIGKRNIVITLGFNPDWEDNTLMALRQKLYAYLLPKAWVRLRFYSSDLPAVDIEGYVESFEPNIFSQDPEVQVSIICPKPDFIETDAIILSGSVDDGTDELVVDYGGTVPTGFEVRVQRTVAVPTYSGPIEIINRTINQGFKITQVTVDTIKTFQMSSIKNKKRAVNVDLGDGTETNLLAYVDSASLWPELRPGENLVSVKAATSGQTYVLAYFTRYGGL